MNPAKQKRLEKAGWKFGDAADFLKLSPTEQAYVELKLALAKTLEQTRKQKGLTQQKLAVKLHTSQPRVAMMEKGDPSVTMDLMIRALLALGIRPKKLAVA
jgi:DNA-binding XRE family transcriptional regulator